MFLRNVWYVAGFSSELPAGHHLTRKFLNESVVLFRTSDGILGALQDRCSHRGMPLSSGQVSGGIIRCAYHGFEFDTRGACTKAPGAENVPRRAELRSYPVLERDQVIWVWMGDPNRADVSLIPGHAVHEDPDWVWRTEYFHLQASWELLIDNLLDLTHLAYVHGKTIGGNPEVHFATKTNSVREGDRVKVARHMPDSLPPATYVSAAGFKGRVDRWQEVEFEPVLVRVSAGACDVGTGALEGRRKGGFGMIMLHGVTPETEKTTHYLWSIATNVKDRGIPKAVFDDIDVTIAEDKHVLEAQQRCLDEHPGGAFVDVPGDVGANQVRRLIRSLAEAESRTAAN